MSTTYHQTLFSLTVSLLVTTCLMPGAARANPVGGQVVAGSATIQAAGNFLDVQQHSNRAIVNWQDFSIGAGETTRFIQPSANAAILNRVTGGNLSQIAGSLQTNGRGYLINSHGVVVGPNGVINAKGGFVASTLDINDGQFMDGGDVTFSGNSDAALAVLGTVKSDNGNVVLIARAVDNQGSIAAPEGKVSLIGGSHVVLKTSGDTELTIQPGDHATVSNSGNIDAVAAELAAVNNNAGALAINNTGRIRATGIVTNPDGTITFAAQGAGTANVCGALTAKNADGGGGKITVDSGSQGLTDVKAAHLDATGDGDTKGGDITLLGKHIAVEATSVIDASGNGGGGTILIGGNQQGEGPPPNGERVWIGPDAVIRTDGYEDGDGGTLC